MIKIHGLNRKHIRVVECEQIVFVLCTFTFLFPRISCVLRRKSSPHGALPHPGHSAATIPSDLAKGCRRAGLQIYIWSDTVSETLPSDCTTTHTWGDL